MSIHQTTERYEGPTIRIECPVCLASDVPASTYDQKIRESYFGVIPLLTSRSTWVVCSACGARLSTRVRAAELPGLTPGELAGLIALRASFLQKTLAVLALAVAIFPIVNLMMSGIAAFANRRIPGWPRTLGRATLIFSLAYAVLFGLLLLFAPRR